MMKEFDLEKLERKTPYKVPEKFFEEMQANVLKQTTQKEKKETKFFRLNFSVVTSIAATLALIFGFTFLWKTNQTDITTIVDTDSVVSVKIPAKESNILKNQDIATTSEVPKTAKELQKPTSEVNITETSSSLASDLKTPAQTLDLNYEQLLNSLTDEELKELSKNSDQDIYLELFN